MGALVDALPAGPLHRWDRAHAFRVALNGGTVGAVDDLEALAGENAFAIRKPGGGWEIVVARDATLVAPKIWRLSRLLRGLGGSEDQAAIAAPAGATVVRLDGAVVPLVDALDEIGVPAVWRFAPGQVDQADARAVEMTATPTALALKPLAPAHLRARRDAAGVRFTWIRRTRIDGDAWGIDEVPLSEESERYELDIRDGGGAPLRTMTSSSPSILYAAAQELADFGAPQTNVSVALAQVSAVAGRGFALERIVPID
jgi:hypothetical protein